MKKNVIVSLADSNYFPLLLELVESIQRFKESENVAIYVLLLPISFLHFQKKKKQHENDKIQDEDDLEDIL